MVITPKAVYQSPVRRAGIFLARMEARSFAIRISMSMLVLISAIVGSQLVSSNGAKTGSLSMYPESVVHMRGTTRSGDTLHLEWDVWFQGDFNRDGVVDVSDLSPLAMYFGHDGSEDAYMAFLSGSPQWHVDVSGVSLIAHNYGVRIPRIEIRLASARNAEYRVAKTVEWNDYELPLNGLPHYAADVTLEETDGYYWVWAVLEPDPEWHYDWGSTLPPVSQ